MAYAFDRMAIEEAGAEPRKLAEAIFRQIPDLVLPVPVHEIALALDIEEIRQEPLTSIEGCLLTDHNKGYGAILVNGNSSRRRQRFTVGHELGHFLNVRHQPHRESGFVCTRQDLVSPAGPWQHRHQEDEANRFAIELLTPRSLLAPYLERDADLEQVLAISSAFDTSREAAARRYITLHDACSAIIFTVEGRVRYVVKADKFPRMEIWANDPLPESLVRSRSDQSLTDMRDVSAIDWMPRLYGKRTSSQTLHQANGHAMTLVKLEPDEDAEPIPF